MFDFHDHNGELDDFYSNYFGDKDFRCELYNNSVKPVTDGGSPHSIEQGFGMDHVIWHELTEILCCIMCCNSRITYFLNVFELLVKSCTI